MPSVCHCIAKGWLLVFLLFIMNHHIYSALKINFGVNAIRKFSIPSSFIRKFSNSIQPLEASTLDPNKISLSLDLREKINFLEFRVGKIVKVDKHPDADELYIEKVDLDEASGPRTIVSGLVRYCSTEDLIDKKIIVLCNLKPRIFKGITSHGMILCASNTEHTKVVPLYINHEVPVGEAIKFDSILPKSDYLEAGNKSNKIFSKLSNSFYVNHDGIATFDGLPFITSSGQVTSPLVNGRIS